MRELFDRAQRDARKSEEVRRAYEIDQRQVEHELQAERELSRQRAHEFSELMETYDIPKIPLCWVGDRLYDRKGLRFTTGLAPLVLPKIERKKVYRDEHELQVLAMGWIAIEKYIDIEHNWGYECHDLFIDDKGNAYQCSQSRSAQEYAVPRYNNDGEPGQEDRALVTEDDVTKLTRTLMRYGIY